MSHNEIRDPLRSPRALDPAIRRDADDAAREGTQRLVARLWRHLRRTSDPRPEQPVHVIDIGGGSGANQAWLGQRLPFSARWTVLDTRTDTPPRPVPAHTTRVVGGVDLLPDLIADGPALLTGSGMLHLLRMDELDDLVRSIRRFSVPALFSLTRTGGLALTPEHEDDDLITRASDARRRQDGRAGSLAAGHVAARLREDGSEVVEAGTPWRLTSAHRELMTYHLRGRAAEAAAHDAALEARAESWLQHRLEQCRQGRLGVVVGHVDLLALPA